MNPASSFALAGRSGQWWALILLLTACFALGGSARGDVAQLVALRPLAVALLGYGLITLRAEQVRACPWAWLLVGACVALPAVQLIPLPPDIWRSLPGRDMVAEIDRAAGLGTLWRPFTMTPVATTNALFAVLVPLAGFVLGVQLSQHERQLLLPVVLVLGGASALAGLIQLLGGASDWLYFYPITNAASEVGLFANRNHQAALLAMLLPMLAVYGFLGGASKRLVAVLGAATVIPLILLAGSRSGLVVALVALIAVPLIVLGLNRPSGARSPRGRWAGLTSRGAGLALALAGIGLIGLTVLAGRGEAWWRLVDTGEGTDQRLQILPVLADMFAAYFPAGTGMGSFERVFQVHEPDALLRPALVNHAHNDWVEVLLDGGLFAAVVLGGAVLAFVVRAAGAWRSRRPPGDGVVFARLGLALIVLEALASLFDYPLRTPIHAMLFMVGVLWAVDLASTEMDSKLLDMRENVNHRMPLAAGDRMT